jgi:hypothetical protein
MHLNGKVFGEPRAIVRQHLLCTPHNTANHYQTRPMPHLPRTRGEQRDLSLEAVGTQCLSSRQPRRARADDDETARIRGRDGRPR